MKQRAVVLLSLLFVLAAAGCLRAQEEPFNPDLPQKYTIYICTADTTELAFAPIENVQRVWPSDLAPLLDIYGDTVRAYYNNTTEDAIVFQSVITRVYFDTLTPPGITGIVNDTLVLVVLPAIQETLPEVMSYSVCPGDTVTFYYPNVPYGYMSISPEETSIWDTLSGAPRFYLFPDTSTVYDLYINNKAGCQIGPFPLSVSLDAVPDFLQILSYDEVCLNSDSFIVEYSPPNALLSGPGLGSDGFFRPWQVGAGEHTLTLSSNSGFCNVSTTKTINIINENDVVFGDIENPCQNDPRIFLNTGLPIGGIYTGTCITEDTVITPALYPPGPYELMYSYAGDDGCRYDKFQTIFIKAAPPKPDLLVFGDTSACAGDTVILGASIFAIRYAWSNGDTTQYLKAFNYGDYFVSIAAANGCRNNSDTLFLGFNPPASITLSSPLQTNGYNVSAVGAADGSIDLSADGGIPPYSFIWSNGANTEDLSELNSGWYFVTLSDSGRCTTRDSIFLSDPVNTSIGSIVGSGEFSGLKIPNGFTPNGDGFNDTWRIAGLSPALERNEMLVFDVRGKLVYRNQNYRAQWDGLDTNGNMLPEGDYFWVFKAANGSLKGNVNLRR
ncbi:MAG: gliding motility-associated C-terminal domain-containing protein [Bacteroidia bacterium]